MTSILEALREAAEALEFYADQYCEGWCKENGGTFEDCGGCKARAILSRLQEPCK